MSQNFKILLLENIHPLAKKILEVEGFTVHSEKKALSEADLIRMGKDFDVVGIRSKTQITQKVLLACPHWLMVGAFCIGTNQIENEQANRLGIPVFNAPYSNTRSVAELVLAEMVALSRHLCDRSAEVHSGQWKKSSDGAHEIRGKVLGIVGYGHIGSQLSILAEALGMRVIFYDVVKKLPLGNSKQQESLNLLLEQSDFVSLHVPETNETKNMLTKNQIQKMKQSSYLINASRGSVVEISALAEALKSGHLAGAAVDVFPEEPESNEQKFHSPLQGLKNIILTPHIGGSTEEAQEAIGQEVADRIVKFLTNGSTSGSVNFPNVDLPKQRDVVRILNMHRNVPGVLGDINKIVSNVGANIRSQYLATDADIGYLVMDLEKTDGTRLMSDIENLKNSLRTRLL